MRARLPVVGTSAATTAFCSASIDGPGPDGSALRLHFDGNGKITAGNGTFDEPRPSALSTVQVEDCPQSTPTCRSTCLWSEHRVLTADLQYVPLRTLSVGDLIFAFDEYKRPELRRRRYRTGRVEKIELVQREVFEVTLSNRKKFFVTEDHQWLIRQSTGQNYEWRRTDELSRLTSWEVPQFFDEWETLTSFDAGWLSGMYDGEGCLYDAGSYCAMTLSQKAGPVLDRACSLISDLFGEETQRHCAQTRDVFQVRIAGGRHETAKVLGALRPMRLLAKFSPDKFGELHSKRAHSVVSVVHAGKREIASVQIDCGTMIVEGYAHHNCYVHNLEAAQKTTHDLFRENSAALRAIVEDRSPGGLAEQWAFLVAAWIRLNAKHGFRWHVSGDVFSLAHTEWIADVVRESAPVRHWIYTRSFAFLSPLVEVSTVKGGNLSVNLSCDRDNYALARRTAGAWRSYEGRFAHSSEPRPRASERLRLCYLVVEGDAPPADLGPDDVIFPDYALRPRQFKTFAESPWWQSISQEHRGLVCPADAVGKSEKVRCGTPGDGRCSRCTR